MKYEIELEKAFAVMENAYVPYSNYKVGACVKLKDGNYIVGANVENAAYSPTMCGERNAIFQAYSQGYRKDDVESITIVTSGKRIGTPCGVCRQVLVELIHQDTPIVLSNKTETRITNIANLLPDSFNEEDLDYGI
ncbi:MAG: cytidine deaminase [Erysipelothrix sp.]|nr:cytidine deaminase [Erysipelothrix sp.]